jgi:hypothetical protein
MSPSIMPCRSSSLGTLRKNLLQGTLCVRDSQHNATEETSGATFSQSCCRKGDVRTSCKIRGDGGSAERAPDAGDINDAESEEVEVEEAAGENVVEERLLREVVRLGARAKIEVPMYEGNLDVEELLDWIRSMDKYFDYEDVDEEKRVRHVVTRLKGHATLWWDELQAERRSKGKQKIKNWDRMVAKLKAKFMPKDYQINLFRKLQNLRQKGMTVKEYTEEFYKLNIRTGQREKDEEKFPGI